MLTQSVETAVNITLAVHETVAERAPQAASAMGKSLNQTVRDCLEQLAGAGQWASELKAFETSTLASPGRRKGWRFDRDKAKSHA